MADLQVGSGIVRARFLRGAVFGDEAIIGEYYLSSWQTMCNWSEEPYLTSARPGLVEEGLVST